MNICVIHPDKDLYSETFIRAHIERLPGRVTSLYGGHLPTHMANGELLLPSPGLPERARRSLLSRLFRINFDEYVFLQRAVQKFLQDQAIDAVLAEFGMTGTRVMDPCQKAGAALIVHFHGYDAYRSDVLQKFAARYRQMFTAADAIIVVSRHMERQIMSLGAPREKVYYVPCGADPGIFYGGEPAKNPPVFLATGRFVEKKAPHLTLLAFHKMLPAVPEAELIMVGDGQLIETCKTLVKALRIDKSVSFPGVKPHEEVARLMREARAFVQHSITPASGDSEGTPVAVMEAGCCGLPVIATRHGGIPDVVADGVTGFLVEERDVDAMADRMIRIARDPDLAARMGRAAREKTLSEFTLEKCITKLNGIIEDTARNHIPRR